MVHRSRNGQHGTAAAIVAIRLAGKRGLRRDSRCTLRADRGIALHRVGDHRTAGDPRRDPEAQHFSPSNRPPVRPRLRYPVIEASQEVVSVCVRGGKVDTKSHWEKVYRTKRPDEVSWYRPHLDVSLRLVHEVAPNRSAAIIDVGGGESTLIDDLLAWGYRAPTILDVSATALAVAEKIGSATPRVTSIGCAAT